jgi:hypothetical protein
MQQNYCNEKCGITRKSLLNFTDATANSQIADLTAEFSELFVHQNTPTGDDDQVNILQEMYRLLPSVYRLLPSVRDFLDGMNPLHKDVYSKAAIDGQWSISNRHNYMLSSVP